MKNRNKLLILIWGLIFSIISGESSILLSNQPAEKLTGFIEVQQMDGEKVTQVALIVTVIKNEDMDFVTYIVTNDETGKKLLDLTGLKIEITGTVTTDAQGVKFITVSDYTILPDEDEELEIPEDMEE